MLRRILIPIAGLAVLVLLVSLWVQRDVLKLALGEDSVASEPLNVGTNVWPGYEPLYLARDLDFYDHSVHLVEYSSATEVIRALRNELIDVGALTLDEVLLLRQSGVDMRVVLVTDVSDGGDVIMAKPEIGSLVDLKGRSVGVESTALGAYVLTRALQTVGLTPTDVQVHQINVDEHHAALSSDRVDAVVTFEPVRSQLLKDGAHQVFDSSQMPGEIVDVVAVRAEVMARKTDQIRLLIDSWFRALTYLSQQPDSASKLMAGRMNLSPEAVLDSFEGLRLPSRAENLSMFDDAHASSLRLTAKKLASIMKKEDLIEGEIDLGNLVAPHFLQTLSP